MRDGPQAQVAETAGLRTGGVRSAPSEDAGGLKTVSRPVRTYGECSIKKPTEPRHYGEVSPVSTSPALTLVTASADTSEANRHPVTRLNEAKLHIFQSHLQVISGGLVV